MIAVMLLATTALGIIAYNNMYPAQQEQKKDDPPVVISPPVPAKPKPNPEYEQFKAELEQHEKHCLKLGKQATIVLSSQSQSQAQRVKECWDLVKIEREYVKDFPAKTIQ
jgi:hypothetical protein